MLDVTALLNQIDSIADQPPPLEFAQAALNDFLLSCSLEPLTAERWQEVITTTQLSKAEQALMDAQKLKRPSTKKQISIVAVWGLGTDLYSITRQALPVIPTVRGPEALKKFFIRLRGVPDEIMARVRFRREEALRAWAEAFDVPIAGESPADSRAKLHRLDYFAVAKEAQSAEQEKGVQLRKAALARMEEEKKRAAEAASRGNYE